MDHFVSPRKQRIIANVHVPAILADQESKKPVRPLEPHRFLVAEPCGFYAGYLIDALMTESGLKKVRSTAPMLMYQHSFSGTS